jgi:phosphocarrier protein FPr
VGICGELASEGAAVPILIGLEIVELSMNPSAVSAIKAEVRRWTMKDAQETARRALGLASAREVRAMLAERVASPRA